MSRTLQSASVALLLSGASSFVPSSLSSYSIRSRLSAEASGDAVARVQGTKQAEETVEGKSILACPVSLSRLDILGEDGMLRSSEREDVEYTVRDSYLDLVSTAKRNIPIWEYSLGDLVKTENFRNPFLSFVYDRGYRQNFARAGFPGKEKEFADISEFFEPLASEDGIAVDLSCGPGFMGREIARSGKFGRLVFADYSESMLREAVEKAQDEGVTIGSLGETRGEGTGDGSASKGDGVAGARLLLGQEQKEREGGTQSGGKSGEGDAQTRTAFVRVDVAQLPFVEGSFDAIHAGAALHCWPSLEESIREVFRVLKKGGRFYASTFKVGGWNGCILPGLRRTSFFYFESKEELQKYLLAAGFSKVDVRQEGQGCLIAKAIK
uniref:Methyltransferase type 11 domain-containing protein n=1 Tax=Chromera velia CCMP2878 TaxID=1169474 RepID=A0A0G4HJA6_9ALVE|eukprot:Cvel_28209.t1-p1 / transcript=Cvel_28209.t1 / gene=Cvel_28209 / organism=Chromera_velia_CCMP2878 / gene_product=Uncharacterized methyltransferase At2g41040,, putative / transcript_product=Uncharacterized methyltransferase At2g41040,, putative / location=Cvel_scaffold3649:7386-10559(-) / protein_length=380 / sequence_SO=supercontig / SO=protein_coding / is_pseudo=false